MTSRAALAAPLILQAPPGQLTNVYDDLVGLVASEGDSVQADEEEFKQLAINAREQHNLEQHIVVDLPDGKWRAILCASAAHASSSGRFLAPRQGITYAVDHETLTTSDAKEYKHNATVESYRSLLQKYLSVYCEDRYAAGVVEVFAVPLPRLQVEVAEVVAEQAKQVDEEQDPSVATGSTSASATDAMEGLEEKEITPTEGEAQAEGEEKEEVAAAQDSAMSEVKDDPVETAKAMEEVEEESKAGPEVPPEKEEIDEETEGETKIVVHIVSNKYKLSNFWSGRWRSSYVLDSASAAEIEGTVKVQVHYFEEGNVQLNSSKAESLTIQANGSEEDRAKAVVRAIDTFEGKYQEELYSTCSELSEGAFKSLRRQLPMTKQKVDWDKVLNYKLGSELTE